MRKNEQNPITSQKQPVSGKTVGGLPLPLLLRLAVGLAVFIVGLLLPAGIPSLAAMLCCFLVVGYDAVMEAGESILRRHCPDDNLLIILAAILAFIVGAENDGAALILLSRLGKTLYAYAADHDRVTVLSATAPMPERARVVVNDVPQTVELAAIQPGDELVLRPGECVPTDCIVTDGYTSVDCSAVTGSRKPRAAEEGDTLMAGSINITSLIHAEALCTAEESTMARIRRFTDEDSADASGFLRKLDRLERLSVPVGAAVFLLYGALLAVFGTLTIADSIHRAVSLLVIFCFSVPVSAAALCVCVGIRGGASRGVLIRNGAVLERLQNVHTVIFDKSGTITTGAYSVESVRTSKLDTGTLLKAAAHAEATASTAAARAVVSSYGGPIDYSIISDFRETDDGCVSASIEGIPILVGSVEFLSEQGVDISEIEPEREAVTLYVSLAGRFAGSIVLSDLVCGTAREAVSQLDAQGVAELVMLSEDSAARTREISRSVGIGKFYSQCLPADKLARVRQMSQPGQEGSTVYVAGENADPAILSAAQVGIVLAGFRNEPAVEAADVIGMDTDPVKVSEAIGAARRTDSVMRQGLLLSLGVKLILLLLTVLGVNDQAWFTAALDGAASAACALNAIRAFPLEK